MSSDSSRSSSKFPRIASWISARLWLTSSVATAPGSTTDTRTCRSVTSWRRPSVNAFTANLVAL